MTPTLESDQLGEVLEPQPHRFTAAEYLKMYEAGVLPPDQRSQLIRGEIYFMAAMGEAHARALRILNRSLFEAYGSRCFIVSRAPLGIAHDSEPEPDFMLLQLESEEYPVPPRDVLLCIEVSDSTLKFDQTIKLAEYARSGIPETWILNLIQQRLEVYRQPSGEQYLQPSVVEPGTPMAPLFAPEVMLEWWNALEPKTTEEASQHE